MKTLKEFLKEDKSKTEDVGLAPVEDGAKVVQQLAKLGIKSTHIKHWGGDEVVIKNATPDIKAKLLKYVTSPEYGLDMDEAKDFMPELF